MTISAPEAIMPACLLAMGVLPLLTLARVVRLSFGRFLVASAFVTYGAMVAAVTFFPLTVVPAEDRPANLVVSSVNLLPLASADGAQFFLNMVMTMPFGFLLPILVPRSNTLRAVTLAGLALSLAIEGTQLLGLITLGNHRIVDIDDLLANTLGASIGYLGFVTTAAVLGGAIAMLRQPGSHARTPAAR